MTKFGNTQQLAAFRKLGLLALCLGLAFGSRPALSETVLRVVPWSDLQVLDPITATDPPTATHARLVYDSLFAPDANQEPQPQMVETHATSDDKLVHTFALRSGLLFHDGKPVTAEDCVASIQRWGARDPLGQLFMAALESLNATGERTFEIRLSRPFPLLTEALARGGIRPPFIFPKRIAETNPYKPITESIGSGPFVFVKDQWVPGSKVVYRKNEQYVPRKEAPSGLAGAKVAYVDRVEFVSFRDAMTVMSALQNGEIDYWPNPPADLIPVLQAAPGIKAAAIPAFTQPLIRFNHKQPPFDNPKAREALSWLVKQDDYLRAIGDPPGLSSACLSFYGCKEPYKTTAGSEALRGPDQKKALALFQEAGWDIKKPIVILHVTDRASFSAITLLLADSLRKAGIAAQLVAMDAATMFQRRTNKGPVGEGGWNIFPADSSGDILTSPVTNPWLSGACDRAFFGWPCDETVERLKSVFLRAETREERIKLAEQIQERAFRQGFYVPLGRREVVRAYRSTIDGLLWTGDLSDVFWNVRKQAQ